MCKKFSIFPAGLLVLLFTVTFYGCFPSDNEIPNDPRSFDPSKTNLRDLTVALPYFKDYLKAMDYANLSGILDAPGPYTIFMPNQNGFTRFRTEQGIDSAEEIPEDTLKRILLYHIIPGRWLLLHTPTGYYPTYAVEQTSKNPIDLYINTNVSLELNGISALDEPDLETVNGVIHSITAVINIPTVLTHLSVNMEFSSIYGILENNLTDKELNAIFRNQGPFTFFAPSNEAMQSFLSEHPEWEDAGDIPHDMLNNLLAYHLVDGKNILLKNIIETGMVSTLNGVSLFIEPDLHGWMIRDQSGAYAKVTRNDIQAENGVIHQIDRVLLP